MKKISLLIAILFATFGLNQMSAQIADLKNAYKGVVKIITYKADGTILRDGTGVFLNKEGDCAASFDLFKGATAADVIDFKGNKRKAWRILGAEGYKYNLVKFSTTTQSRFSCPQLWC